MDIVKSLLVFYSNSYLYGSLDHFVAETFGQAFRSFSRLKRLASEPGYDVRTLKRDTFREDDVFRYHYQSFRYEAAEVSDPLDYNATAESVLEKYLKPALKNLRGQPERLEAFIRTYVEDLSRFFATFERLIAATRTDLRQYQLWVMQDLAATLIPLVVRLDMQGRLCERDETSGRDILDLIEASDLRVFKVRGTNPQADVFKLTRALGTLNATAILTRLRAFCQEFMPDSQLRSRLQDEAIYKNPGVTRMLLELDDRARTAGGQAPLGLTDLVTLTHGQISVEHVLPQDADDSFDVTGHGFADREEYLRNIHCLGNLLLLERRLNSACGNHTVDAKVTLPNLYRDSGFASAVQFAAAHCAPESRFDRAAMQARGVRLAEMVIERWGA
jgi:hypothetical protein